MRPPSSSKPRSPTTDAIQLQGRRTRRRRSCRARRPRQGWRRRVGDLFRRPGADGAAAMALRPRPGRGAEVIGEAGGGRCDSPRAEGQLRRSNGGQEFQPPTTVGVEGRCRPNPGTSASAVVAAVDGQGGENGSASPGGRSRPRALAGSPADRPGAPAYRRVPGRNSRLPPSPRLTRSS